MLDSLLFELVKQVPRGGVTTYDALARALGDPIAAKWVRKTLSEDGNEKVKKREGVVMEGRVNGGIFEDFVTSYPLKRHAKTQVRLARKIVLEGDLEREYVAGIDVSYGEEGRGALSIFDMDGNLIKELTIVKKAKFPYIPTYLSFREGGFIIELVKMLSKEEKNCILLIDGNGYMHPRRCGLASHVGVVLDMPTIGVAKSRLCGKLERGEIYLDKELVGFKMGKRYVSPGHRVSVYGALRFVKNLLEGGVDPLRRAHRSSRPESDRISDPAHPRDPPIC